MQRIIHCSFNNFLKAIFFSRIWLWFENENKWAIKCMPVYLCLFVAVLGVTFNFHIFVVEELIKVIIQGRRDFKVIRDYVFCCRLFLFILWTKIDFKFPAVNFILV